MQPTLINTCTVLVGSLLGLLLHNWVQDRYRSILFQAIGLVTSIIGLKYGLQTQDFPLLALSMITGGLLGEWIDIEGKLQSVGQGLKRIMGQDEDVEFIEAFTFSSVLFCAGAMTLVGCIRAGTLGEGDLLYTKSILDGFASLFLASAMGAGVLASSFTIFTFQGGLTLLFMMYGHGFPPYIITEIGAAGGLLIAGISINILDIGKVRVSNFLPSLFLAGLFIWMKHTFF